MLGPVDYLEIGFPGNKFNGSILKELQKVVDKGLVRVIDLLFISKDGRGQIAIWELQDMPEDVTAAVAKFAADLTGLLTEEDAIELGKKLDNNCSAALLVFEHLWAVDFKDAVKKADGILIDEGRIHPEDIEAALEELKAEA